MNARSYLYTTLALALFARCAPSLADDIPGLPASSEGMQEVSDADLATMRGRYTAGDNVVAYFGVQMISTWQSSNGQTLQGSLALNMNFEQNPDLPQVSFVPTITITKASATPNSNTVTATVQRSIDSSGLNNVAGVTQGVQVAGDNNAASNVTSLNVQNGGAIPVTASNTAPGSHSVSSGDASATVSFDGNSAQVLLTIAGQGAVQQWIRQGSIGQTIALGSDNQMVRNQLEITLIRRTLADNAQLMQNVAQSLYLTHGIVH